MQKGGNISQIRQPHYIQQNQQVIHNYQSVQQNQVPMMQGQIQSQPVYIQNGQNPQIRMNMNGPRMAQFATAQPFVPGGYQQNQQQGYGYQVQQPYGGQQQFQYLGYPPRGQYQQVYMVPQGGYPSNVVMQQQMPASQGQHIPGTRSFNQISATQLQPQHPIQTSQQEQPAQPKKRPVIVLKDPTTGKDVTSEILKKKTERTTPSSGYSSTSSTPPLPQDDKKAKIQAAFAAQVAAVASSSSSPHIEAKAVDNRKITEVPLNINPSQPLTSPVENKTIEILAADKAEGTLKNEVEEVKNKKKDIEETKAVDKAVKEKTEEKIPEKIPEQISQKLQENPPEQIPENIAEKIPEKISEMQNTTHEHSQSTNDNGSTDVQEPTQEKPPLVAEENISSQIEEIVESPPENLVVAPFEGTVDDITNSESEKSAFSSVQKKKKGKQRFKEFDAKDSANNSDMLSAFVDKPAEVVEKEPEVPKLPEKSPEDETWEAKAEKIDKEVITNENVEEPEVASMIIETVIISPKDSSDLEKLQYDRDFLLKFQFAPICTSKPEGLPDIDIVLNQAHAPTKALIPGQRISASNDFMPQFMRSTSGGGRSSSGGRLKGGRVGSMGGGGGRPQKVIQIPQFQKIELKKSENAWVRPSEQDKALSEEDRCMKELGRNVRSILNKLTPQKFKTLVDQMLDLKIDNAKKLEAAIDLIFEKAVSEPGFSVAYANMCRVLTDNFKCPVTTQGDKSTHTVVTFRKVLLNKCQKEFEKESSDEKLLEEDRLKKFETEEEKKAWKEQLDYREMMNRRRMLGNIRFIGELFKLKMISENIMHDCILKLLRAEKQDSLEDQLECLCKLLTTIGKDLDHQKAKPRMDQYFVQIRKIMEKKKISSRIKFALQDVMDLRLSNWVPRRDEGNPKTIDQIHREAVQKEREQENARQQEKLQRKFEPRGGRGGRDSPVVRSSGGSSQGQDGWTNVSNKSGRVIASAPVDASKFRLTKKTDSEISLGPGGRPGAWSKGASGGGSRSGSGANTPTGEMDQRPNRFDVLSESTLTPSSLDGKSRGGSSRNNMPRKGTPTGGRGRMGSDDGRSSALRAVKDLTARSSRNSSPARSSPSEDTYSAPSSGSQTPVDKSPSPVTTVDVGKMRKVAKSTVEEYFGCGDLTEVLLCVRELGCPSLHHIFVEESISVVLEKKSEQRRKVGNILHYLLKEQCLNIEDMCQGFAAMVDLAQDLACDVPLIYKYLGEVLGPVVYDGTLPLNKVKNALEPLVQQNKAGHVMAEALFVAVEVAGNEDPVGALWFESSVTWDMLLNNNENTEQFVKDKKIEFTLKSPRQAPSHSSQIQEEMLRIFKERVDVNDKIMTLISEKVSAAEQSSTEFIRELTKSVCSSTISTDDSKTCTCNNTLLAERKNIMVRYINGNKDLELHALYAVQQLVTDFHSPRDMLPIFFEELYQLEVVSEDTFYAWESSKDFPDGKGVALSHVKGFLSWLRKAEEEQNEDEISTSQTNVA